MWLSPGGSTRFKPNVLGEQLLTSGSELWVALSDGSSTRKESTQRPNATASHSWICLLQISRDILAITAAECWGDDFVRACVDERGGGLVLTWTHVHYSTFLCTHMHLLDAAQQLYTLIKVLLGLSCWHASLTMCNCDSVCTWIIQVTPISFSTCGVCRLSCQLPLRFPPSLKCIAVSGFGFVS